MALTLEQLKLRKTGIGGSDAAAVMGMSRYRTPLDVWNDKLDPELKEIDSNFQMRVGTILEEEVANEYAKRKGVAILNLPTIIQSIKYPWMLANIDRWVKDGNLKYVLECKYSTYGKDQEWGDEESDQIPTEYLFQVAHYRIVTQCPFVVIAVQIGARDFKTYTYQPNESLEELLIQEEEKFWKMVESRTEPNAITYKEACKKYSVKLSDIVVAEPIDDELVSALKMAQEEVKDRELQVDKLKAAIVERLKGAAQLVDIKGNILATYKIQSRKCIDQGRLEKLYPKEYGDVLNTIQFKVLRVK